MPNIHPMSEENKKIVSDKAKKRWANPEFKNRMSESAIATYSNPKYKKKISEQAIRVGSDPEVRKRRSENAKKQWGNKEMRKKMSKGIKDALNLPETRKKLSDSQIGEKGSNWQGGISFFPYCPKFNRKLKEKIRNRDNRTCQLCNNKENGRKHTAHHIHYDRENCNPDLITLCCSCNSKVNIKRDFYESLFMNKLNDRGLLFWTSKNSV